MEKKVNADKHLVGHYASLGNLESDFRNRNLYALVTALVKGERVVDIGCGVGEFVRILKAQGKSVKGVEPSEGMRRLAREINPEIIISAELDRNERAEAVTMLDVLEHIEDDSGQVRSVRSILEPAGEFVFVVPAHPVLYGERDRQMGHCRRYSKELIKNLLEANGFEVVSMRHWNALGFLPYFVCEKIFKKPLNSGLRKKSSPMQKLLDLWFNKVENNFDFGFGLSIIGVARKSS
jgi:2-polyprenyl-3-methyl-5-hydroxy-6-metoxy-1,4-benzoquinol methylase